MTENTAIKEIVRQTCEGCYSLDDSEVGMCKKCGYQMAIQALEEIQQYRAIGTIEEFKALKEKSVAKKPKMIGYRKDGEPVYQCGCCGSTLKVADQPFCMICSCEVDWK